MLMYKYFYRSNDGKDRKKYVFYAPSKIEADKMYEKHFGYPPTKFLKRENF